MNEISMVDPIELGGYLAQARERAGIKQAELARNITWSPALLSRIETGERSLTWDELTSIVKAIGTPETEHLLDTLPREWKVIPRPPLDHPDQDILWDAELVIAELNTFREKADIKHAFGRRLTEYVEAISQIAAKILQRNYQIAFIGSVGIGKSTAICRLTGLEVADRDGGTPKPVLEAGAGRITICEVHLRSGPEYGLIIEPRSDDEIRADVLDFAEHLKFKRDDIALQEEAQSEDGSSQGISKEVERAIRNMSKLTVRRPKATEGRKTRHDEAKELAQQQDTVSDLVVEVLARMELHKRARRDVWYDGSCGKPPLVWLKNIFEEVNNGRHPEFTLPKRIEVVVPDQILNTSDTVLRIIDTKGIDHIATRADLERHMDGSHTLTVLCSGFNDAPGAEPQLLLKRALESGIRSLKTHSVLMVLPQYNQALAVKDESGILVESAEEGYELKGEQVELALESLGLTDFPICFFNAYQDSPEQLRNFFNERIMNIRQTFRSRLHEVTTQSRNILLNHEQDEVHEVIRHATLMLKTWADDNSILPRVSIHVQDSLIMQMNIAYASTIRATIRRDGEWSNLSYSHHLGYGARRLAALYLSKALEDFSVIIRTMVGNPEYEKVQDFLNQAERVLLEASEDLLRKVQIIGQILFGAELKGDSNFWSQCRGEWGQGPGYKNRVIKHNMDWFESEKTVSIQATLWRLIEQEWTMGLSRMTALLEIDV